MTSANEMTNDSSVYVFDPINNVIKICLVFPTILTGIYGLIANSLILYFMYKKTTTNYQMRAFSRRSLIDRFIQSLALSDVLCSVTSLPIYVTEILTNFINTDATCRASRYVMFYFPVVTIMNYLFIGIERYLGVYHPLKVPSELLCKRLIVVAWILGAIFSGLAVPSYGLVRYDMSDDKYTFVCKYHSSTVIDRIHFLGFTIFIYVIPSVILTTTSVLILKFLRRFPRRFISPENSPTYHNDNGSSSTSANASRLNLPTISRRVVARQGTQFCQNSFVSSSANASGYKVTSMFVSLIFAFIIPYMLFIFYNSLAIILNLKVSFTVDYVIRMMAGVLVYANGAVVSTILFYNSSYLREQLEALFIKVFIPRVFTSNDDGIVLNSLGPGQQQEARTSEQNKHFDTKQ